MVFFANWADIPITINLKTNSLTLSLEKKFSTDVFSFDRSHRLWTAMIEGVSYRRGLNGNIVAKWNSGNDVLNRKWLLENEKIQLLFEAHKTVKLIINDLFSDRLKTKQKISEEMLSALDSISKIDIDFYKKDIRKYHEIYKPVGILPPDQYMSVVLQMTEGCSFNTCTFCTFYKDRPFKIKTLEEFNSHVRKVKEYLSESIQLRRTIFLGDANALVVPTPKLIPLLRVVHNHLDVEKMGGLFAFLDGFSGEKKSYEDYKALQEMGLKKIYIGLESGNNDLLSFLKKPGNSETAVSAVYDIKKANISVAIIILLGAGGRKFQQAHISDSIKILNQMNLDADDIIYFSELIESEDVAYTREAFLENLEPLSSAERIEQGKSISNGLVFSKNGTPHISRYDIRDFVY